ncbi:Phloretin 4'-O-glucosyltransferase [Trichinella pseudospiralis]
MHLQILENVTIYQINKSLSKLAWISRFPAISYLYIIFGSLGVLTNLLWMVKLWYVKKKKRVHYYYICYAVASVMTSATFILEYGRLLAYEILPITIAEIVFFMSWDVYVTISSTKCHGRKISRQQQRGGVQHIKKVKQYPLSAC